MFLHWENGDSKSTKFGKCFGLRVWQMTYSLFLTTTVVLLSIDLVAAYYLTGMINFVPKPMTKVWFWGLVIGFAYLYALLMACWNMIKDFQKHMLFIALNCLIANIGLLVGTWYSDDCAKVIFTCIVLVRIEKRLKMGMKKLYPKFRVTFDESSDYSGRNRGKRYLSCSNYVKG